jgi:carbamoyltransferase
MNLLGIAGLADVETFLNQRFPAEMAGTSKIVQGMDAAAAMICGGKVIAAASEERFDRVKKSGAFPFHAIDYCLRTAEMRISDVSAVCGNFNFGRYAAVFSIDPMAKQYYSQCLSPEAISNKLSDHYGCPVYFKGIDHHDAHLHTALASAPFDDCLAIVMDAAGEVGATTIYSVDGNDIQRVTRYPIHQSLGMFYSLITQFLGFTFNEDEYKIMGLAALGNPDRYAAFFESAIVLGDDGKIEIPCLSLNKNFTERMFFTASSKAIEQGLGFDGTTCSMEQRADVSASLQRRFTEALFHLCDHYKGTHRNLLLSGGCAENCSAAGEVRNSGMFDAIHVAFASGDEGTALGAAAAHAFERGKRLRIPGELPFYGPAPDLAAVRSLALDCPISVERLESEQDMLERAAVDIAANHIVGLCHGRMEFGARALGNRSLLANPGYADNKDRVNEKIKKRQNYRPFAPAVLAEDAHIYFDLHPGEMYPYMTMLTTVREEWRGKLPAITHIDGTARVQTVTREHNPAFYHFLSALKKLTGLGVVLNTSYNVNHQPIVCTAKEGIETFLEMGIDALYMAEARITRR